MGTKLRGLMILDMFMEVEFVNFKVYATLHYVKKDFIGILNL